MPDTILKFFLRNFLSTLCWNILSRTHEDVRQDFAIYFSTRGEWQRFSRGKLTVMVDIVDFNQLCSEEQVRMVKAGRYYRQKMLRDDYCQTFHRETLYGVASHKSILSRFHELSRQSLCFFERFFIVAFCDVKNEELKLIFE